jgi:glycosyltransferase involved in cell wall biosynthesis
VAARALRPLVLVDTVDVGGAGKVVLEGVRGLVAAGVPVAVVNFRYPGRPSAFDARARELGADVVSIEQRSRLDWSFVPELARLAAVRGVTLLESHSFKAHLLASRLAARLHEPWLAFAHGWTAETRRVRLYNALERRLLRRPDRVIAVARPIADRLRAAGRRGPVDVLPNGLEPSPAPPSPEERARARATLGLAPGERVGIVIGRLSREKGVDVLLAALARRGGPALTILVAGDGPARAGLEAAIARDGLGRTVRLLGQVADVRPLYAAADLLVLPSRSEGLPNVVLEALDAALPVVATRVGALPELVDDGRTGRLVAADDPAGLAAALDWAASAPDLPAHGRAGRERILPRYTAAGRRERLLALYATLARPAPGAPVALAGMARP